MAGKKKFFKQGEAIRDLAMGHGGCFATDKIMVEGRPVGYAYRERPDHDCDSGWRFLAGDEDDTYMDNAANHGIYDCNTVANYDPAIIELLNEPIGSAFYRDHQTGEFVTDAQGAPSSPDK